MSAERPTAAPQLVAALIESTPERVRRRLDRTPDAATVWDWQAGEKVWIVKAGDETVTLPHGQIVSVEQVTCTCLLSPRCFHVLACLTQLMVAHVESIQAEEPVEPPGSESTDDLVLVDANQQRAASEMVNGVAQLLRVGIANAGVVVQSGLLRAVHQCRAEQLHRLSASGLRVIAGVSEFRNRAPASDPLQLAEDLADVLETSRHLLRQTAIAGFWIGTARRQQAPVRPRKLHGLFAEPLITRSGFAGAAVYFLGEDDRIYSASDVRPGDAQHARDTYLGGIEIGPLVQPAKQLARGQYLGTDLTASLDGRLGRGKGIKIVEQGQSTWQAEPIQKRFARPWQEQCNEVFENATMPPDALSAGWDFVFLTGAVLGALGPELLFQPSSRGQSVRLAIANESKSLYFRENLRMLSHAPGLRLQVIARVNLQEPSIVYPLAIAAASGDAQNADEPALAIPESWANRICLGFDEIHSKHLVNGRAAPLVLGEASGQPEKNDPLATLQRRWIATMLSGSASQRPTRTNTLAAETASLQHAGFSTGAALLDLLSHAREDGKQSSTDAFLATATYFRNCLCELAKLKAL